MGSIEGNRQRHIDLLRALGMLYIVAFWHLDDYIGDPWHTPFSEMATYGVLNIFVYLSSFLLTRKHGNLESCEMIVGFLSRRVLRIYPLYLYAVVIFYWLFEVTRYELVSALLLVNMFTGASIFTLWFIGLIFSYYILLAVILFRFSWLRFAVVSVLFLLCIGALFVFKGQLDKRVALYFPSFLLGIMAGKSEDIRIALSKDSVVVSGLLSSAGLLVGYYWFLADWSPNLGKLSLYGGGFFLIFPVCELARRFSGKCNERAIYFLGYSSFCMYLYHRIIYHFMLTVFHPLEDLFVLAYLLVVGVPVVIIASYLLQCCHDRLLKWIPKFRQPYG